MTAPAYSATAEHARARNAAFRPVYRYSVVPGGVYSPGELDEARLQDPVVAAHYAGLRTAQLRPAILEADGSAYVSYRLRGAVYWTRRPVRLARGELVLADDRRPLVRARCGNQISNVPRNPVSDQEPPEEIMDQGEADRSTAELPLSPGRSLAILDLNPSPLPESLIPPVPVWFDINTSSGEVTPYGPQPPYIGPVVVDWRKYPAFPDPLTPEDLPPPDEPLSPVPEPGTLVLMPAAGLALWLLKRRR